MVTLKELLDDIEVEVPGDDKKEEVIDLKNINLDDIPEKQRPIFQTLLKKNNDFEIELSKRDLVIQNMRDMIKEKPKEEKIEEKKVLGILNEDDPYAPAFKKIADSIDSLASLNKTDKDQEYKTSVINFAKENKDMVKYVKEMDMLVDRHPSLKTDIKLLYNMAKQMKDNREKKSSEKREEINNERRVINFTSEFGGFSSDNIRREGGGAKSIAEALGQAVDKLSTMRR